MKQNSLKFFYSIILPSILAILLFIISMYAFLIPSFEKNMMNKKKEMIRELTNTAWSLIKEYDDEYKDSLITFTNAQKLASEKIEKMRYGAESKDYFWITDTSPMMIMHPYRPELNDSILNEYKDPRGVRLFMESKKVVENEGEGFINYMWQWKDDSTQIVPKLSYVKGFENWGWIIGTGIYLDDVQSEIGALKGRLIRISLLISAIIILTLIFVIRQSLKIEAKRKKAEDELIQSRQKYKTLVETSSEGTIMIMDNQIIFSNQKFEQLTGKSHEDLLQLNFEDLFSISWEEVMWSFEKPNKSISLETQVKQGESVFHDVVISITKIFFEEQEAFVVVTKDISRKKQTERITQNLSSELQSSLILMNQPISQFVKPIVKCNLQTTVAEAAALMDRKKMNIIFIADNDKMLGVVNDSDLRKRVLARGKDGNSPLVEVMTSPIVCILNTSLLYEVVLEFRKQNISHLAVKDKDDSIIGVLSREDILEIQHNSLSYILREIEFATDVNELKKIYDKIPVLVNALLESGDKTELITHIITSVADAMTKRIITFAIEDHGEPPCRFAFVALGSEGRKEQTIATDQDNSIIFEDIEENNVQKIKNYFLKFAETVNNQLAHVGYELCTGEIMAKNPKYTLSLSDWKKQFTKWITTPEPQNVIDTSVFFDFRCIYGDNFFTDELRKHINLLIDKKAVFVYHLAHTVIRYKLPVNMFGNITSGDNETFNIKKILLPVVTFIKVFSLQRKIAETNTLQRLDQLLNHEIIQKSMYEELKQAYNFLMGLRFHTQTNALKEFRKPDNNINIQNLTEIEKSTLKKVLSLISEMQTKLGLEFKER
jgi:PAS domain S-box-containing protein